MKKPSNYLDQADLINLELYEYHGGEYSYIDTILNPFWLKVAYAFPNWYAPNLITLTGLIVNMIASLLVAFYDPMLIGRAPAWVYVNAAICLQVYAVLDAADGKQARRLNASSPLGQIFDHGCDAVNLTFIIISCLSAAGLMIGKTSAAVLVFMYFSFVTAQLVEYQSNVLLAGSKVFGVTEAMLLMTIMMLITAFCGVDIWNVQLSTYLPFLSVFGDGVPGKNIVAFGMIIVVTLTCVVFGIQSFIRPSPIPEEKRGNKNLDRTSYLLRFVPQIVIAACGYYLMTSDLMATHSLYVIFFVGLTFAFLSIRVNIAHLCRRKLTYHFREMLPLVIVTVNQIFHVVRSSVLVPVCFCLFMILFVMYIVMTINQIKEHLHIRAFHVVAKTESIVCLEILEWWCGFLVSELWDLQMIHLRWSISLIAISHSRFWNTAK